MTPKILICTVGGDTCTKDGLGTVTTGNEVVLPLDNPWDILALRELQAIASHFAACQFSTVHQIAESLTRRSDTKKRYYDMLKTMGSAYGFWDIFLHKRALIDLKKLKSELNPFVMQHCPLTKVYACVEKNIAFLTAVCEDAAYLCGGNTAVSLANRLV